MIIWEIGQNRRTHGTPVVVVDTPIYGFPANVQNANTQYFVIPSIFDGDIIYLWSSTAFSNHHSGHKSVDQFFISKYVGGGNLLIFGLFYEKIEFKGTNGRGIFGMQHSKLFEAK